VTNLQNLNCVLQGIAPKYSEEMQNIDVEALKKLYENFEFEELEGNSRIL